MWAGLNGIKFDNSPTGLFQGKFAKEVDFDYKVGDNLRGCEGIADFLYEYINTIMLPDYGEGDRVWCSKVEVRETASNMAMRIGHRADGEFDE